MTQSINQKVTTMKYRTNNQTIIQSEECGPVGTANPDSGRLLHGRTRHAVRPAHDGREFDKIGVGQWFRYVTGGIEVASAILLLIPRLTPVGDAFLLATMTGAVLTASVLDRPFARAGVCPVVLRRDHPVGPVRNPESIAGQTARAARACPNSVTCEK